MGKSFLQVNDRSAVVSRTFDSIQIGNIDGREWIERYDPAYNVNLGSLAGLPLGLIAFNMADPVLVRAAAGAMIVVFAGVLAANHWRRRGAAFGFSRAGDLAAGAISGVATALVGMAGPPVLIYLMLAGAPPRAVRATLLTFFALVYAATLLARVAVLGVPRAAWLGSRTSDRKFVWETSDLIVQLTKLPPQAPLDFAALRDALPMELPESQKTLLLDLAAHRNEAAPAWRSASPRTS